MPSGHKWKQPGLYSSINWDFPPSFCDTDTVFQKCSRPPATTSAGGKKRSASEGGREGETELTQTGWSRLHVLRLWQSKLLRCSRRRRRTRVAAVQAHSHEHQPRNFKAWTYGYYLINGNQKKKQMTEITTVELLGSLFGMAIKFTGSEDLTKMVIFLASSYLSTSLEAVKPSWAQRERMKASCSCPRKTKPTRWRRGGWGGQHCRKPTPSTTDITQTRDFQKDP